MKIELRPRKVERSELLNVELWMSEPKEERPAFKGQLLLSPLQYQTIKATLVEGAKAIAATTQKT